MRSIAFLTFASALALHAGDANDDLLTRMVQKLDASENTGHCQVGLEGCITTLRGDFFVM